jgi:signal transduction histidine kinase
VSNEIAAEVFRQSRPESPEPPRVVLGKRRRKQPALTRLLAGAEENERRRIARELHDTTAQDLFAIDLNLHRIERSCAQPQLHELFSETCDLLKRAQHDIRTMSFLLHPPPVDESGLASALESMVEELGNRSGLKLLFQSNLIARLPELFETNLYRVVQEALINVQRHARATQAVVRCTRRGDFITIEIEDDGIGLAMDPEAALAGVGMRAMRDRVNEIDGVLTIVPLHPGTLVRAIIPDPETCKLQ